MSRRSIDSLQHSGIRLFTFKTDRPSSSYTVCSAPASDSEIMDASTLMSPDYVQPLIPSELGILVRQVFDADNVSCLKHLAAKKLVHAQGARLFPIPMTGTDSRNAFLHGHRSVSPTPITTLHNTSLALVSQSRAISPYIHARLFDHTQQQERLAQIRLAKWAGDLQRSLQNERARYEAKARRERAVWPRERLGETIVDATGASPQQGAVTKTPDVGRIPGYRGFSDTGDPLGLFRWNEAMTRRGWIAFQVVGSFGIMGAVAVWLARTWGGDGYTTWTRGMVW